MIEPTSNPALNTNNHTLLLLVLLEHSQLTDTVGISPIDDLMLIRLDHLETSKLSRLREPRGWVVGDHSSHSIGVRLVATPVQGRVGASMRLVLTRMIVLCHTNRVGTRFNTVDQSASKLVVSHGCSSNKNGRGRK